MGSKLSQACGCFALWAGSFLVYAVLWNDEDDAIIDVRVSLFLFPNSGSIRIIKKLLSNYRSEIIIKVIAAPDL